MKLGHRFEVQEIDAVADGLETSLIQALLELALARLVSDDDESRVVILKVQKFVEGVLEVRGELDFEESVGHPALVEPENVHRPGALH